MSADGTWNMKIVMPNGERDATLVLGTSEGRLTGTYQSRLGLFELDEGSVEGKTLSWKASPALGVEPFRPVEPKDGDTPSDGDGPASQAPDGDGPPPTAEQLAEDPVFVAFSGTIDGDTMNGDLNFGGAGRRMSASVSGTRA